MKYLCALFLGIILLSCSPGSETDQGTNYETVDTLSQEQESTEIQKLFDSISLNGSVLIYDPSKDIYYSNDLEWAHSGHLPASTFKITNSIIALETGVVEDDSTMFKWDGKKRRLSFWERDMVFRDAFHLSCVPCYQDIARKIGTDRMIAFLDSFKYGNMFLDSNSIDLFWLEGESKITQFEQIAFLKKFYNSDLPIKERTENIMKRLMVIDKNDSYTISGKTGWSIRDGNNIGWFVGFVEVKEDVYYFATKVEPKEDFDMDQFASIRKKLSFEALKALGII